MKAKNQKFWKCPSCGQTIENQFDACWNCQGEKPEKAEQPSRKEIKKYHSEKPSAGTFKAGLLLMAVGGLVMLLGYSSSTYHRFEDFYTGRYIFGAFFILIGVAIIFSGLFGDSAKK